MTGLCWSVSNGRGYEIHGPHSVQAVLARRFGEFPIVLRPADVKDLLVCARETAADRTADEVWDELMTALCHHQRITVKKG